MLGCIHDIDIIGATKAIDNECQHFSALHHSWHGSTSSFLHHLPDFSWTSWDLPPAAWMIAWRVIPSFASMLANFNLIEVSNASRSIGDWNVSESQLIQSAWRSSPDAVTTAATTCAFHTSKSWILGQAGITIFSCSFLEMFPGFRSRGRRLPAVKKSRATPFHHRPDFRGAAKGRPRRRRGRGKRGRNGKA